MLGTRQSAQQEIQASTTVVLIVLPLATAAALGAFQLYSRDGSAAGAKTKF